MSSQTVAANQYLWYPNYIFQLRHLNPIARCLCFPRFPNVLTWHCWQCRALGLMLTAPIIPWSHEGHERIGAAPAKTGRAQMQTSKGARSPVKGSSSKHGTNQMKSNQGQQIENTLLLSSPSPVTEVFAPIYLSLETTFYSCTWQVLS